VCVAKNQSPFIKVECRPVPAALKVSFGCRGKLLLLRNIAARAGFASKQLR